MIISILFFFLYFPSPFLYKGKAFLSVVNAKGVHFIQPSQPEPAEWSKDPVARIQNKTKFQSLKKVARQQIKMRISSSLWSSISRLTSVEVLFYGFKNNSVQPVSITDFLNSIDQVIISDASLSKSDIFASLLRIFFFDLHNDKYVFNRINGISSQPKVPVTSLTNKRSPLE